MNTRFGGEVGASSRLSPSDQKKIGVSFSYAINWEGIVIPTYKLGLNEAF
ncbi:MAG: hypothetical protein AAF740_02155 [Bacteroidota bacterium]